jgi:large subunit ribosomal protein L29
MKIRDLREKTENELKTLLKENREKVRQMKFDLVNKQLKNPRQIKEYKKDIARILTLLKKNY